jgi:hypothetical protein
MSWQEQMTFEEKRRIIAKAKEALEKAKFARADVERKRLEELKEMEKWQKKEQ